MKFSLLFLVFVVLWSALVVHTWQHNIRCNKLTDSIQVKNQQIGNLKIADRDLQSLKEIESAKKELVPVESKYKHMRKLIEGKEFADLDLKSLSTNQAVVGELPSTIGGVLSSTSDSISSRACSFKVLIPSNRKIELRANFAHKTQTGFNQSESFQLPPGEYVITLDELPIPYREQKKAGKGRILLTVSSDQIEQTIRWAHSFKYSAFGGSGGTGQPRLRDTKILENDGTPVLLYSGSRWQKFAGEALVRFTISMADVTTGDDVDQE